MVEVLILDILSTRCVVQMAARFARREKATHRVEPGVMRRAPASLAAALRRQSEQDHAKAQPGRGKSLRDVT
jgi:hypothetical protein